MLDKVSYMLYYCLMKHFLYGFLITIVIIVFFTIYVSSVYKTPIVNISSCINVSGDSPEGLYFDGIYVWDGPENYIYKIKKVGTFVDLYYYLFFSNRKWCDYLENKK